MQVTNLVEPAEPNHLPQVLDGVEAACDIHQQPAKLRGRRVGHGKARERNLASVEAQRFEQRHRAQRHRAVIAASHLHRLVHVQRAGFALQF